MNDLIPIVAILASFGSALFVVWTVMAFVQRSRQTRVAAEFHSRLLDRLGSTKDFSEFLNSEGGSRFMDSLALQREATPQMRVLRATSAGIVLSALGMGLAILSGEMSQAYDRDFANGVAFLSAISLSLGIGLILAAWATTKVAKRLGLLDEPSTRPQTPSTH
jgi:hypothetical protein